MAKLVKIVNDTLSIKEELSSTLSLTFEFYDPLYIGGAIINNSDQIIFTPDGSDSKYITGFAVRVADPNKKKVKTATMLGNRTVNYLSAMTGVAVRSKRPKIEKHAGDTLERSPNLLKINLNASKVTSLLTGKLSRNKKIDNYQSGVTALKDIRIEVAVQKLYQVIEKSGLKDAKKYKHLRDACSHHRIDGMDAVKTIRGSRIKCIRHKPVDFTDPDNWQQLYIHAHALQKVADDHIKKILASS